MHAAPRAGFKWDFVVRDSGGRAALTIEVRSRPKVDASWAETFAGRFGPGVPDSSLLLVGPDRSFWWPEKSTGAPKREASTPSFLAPYLAGIHRVDEVVLMAAVGFWLQDLVDGVAEAPELLAEIDPRRLRGGTVYREARA